MSERDEKIERRLRHAGLWVGGGLLVELLTLPFAGPGAFLAFATFSGLGIAVGVFLYLRALVS